MLCLCLSELTFAAQWWSGSTITVYMEDVKYLQTLGREHVIAMFNHKCDLDWLMSLVIAERLGMMGVSTWSVRSETWFSGS